MYRVLSEILLPVLLYRLQPGGGCEEGGVLSPGPLHLPGHTRGDLQHAESQHPQQLVRHARGEGRRLLGLGGRTRGLSVPTCTSNRRCCALAWS